MQGRALMVDELGRLVIACVVREDEWAVRKVHTSKCEQLLLTCNTLYFPRSYYTHSDAKRIGQYVDQTHSAPFIHTRSSDNHVGVKKNSHVEFLFVPQNISTVCRQGRQPHGPISRGIVDFDSQFANDFEQHVKSKVARQHARTHIHRWWWLCGGGGTSLIPMCPVPLSYTPVVWFEVRCLLISRVSRSPFLMSSIASSSV